MRKKRLHAINHKCSGKEVVPAKTSGQNEVRSEAEVKHGTVHFLANWTPLQLDTNLNIPPTNWLRRSSKLEQYLHGYTRMKSAGHSQFSSIEMANNSPDLTGEVDVISNAENIKSLLKLPFGNNHISMMVHRIGKTLLIDDFDIHKHLLRREQAHYERGSFKLMNTLQKDVYIPIFASKNSGITAEKLSGSERISLSFTLLKAEWEWLRRFYHESVQRDLQEKMRCVPRKNKSRDSLQNRNMFSKFLYHSVNDLQTHHSDDVEQDDSETALKSGDEVASLVHDPLAQSEGTSNLREVLWTFEDLRMLIGTDLPIFCNDSYYVSLRLRDMRTPINVLTGLDYWLDNLMCNVPEIAMCFHINGIVKKYEVIKTEDIPSLENSKFDPQVVTDIAKNILSFLKTSATKEGHTYWLYKGADDDIVKLYDLTALCVDEMDRSDNPFAVPIGMLLYRVARNMRQHQGRRKAATIRTLLENCLVLLDEEKHSQVCTSANYLLCDLYVPDSTLQDDWSIPSSDDSEDEDLEEEVLQEACQETDAPTTVDVRTLSTNNGSDMSHDFPIVKHQPFIESAEERCLRALRCLKKGLDCLNRDLSGQTRKPRNIIEQQATCNSDEAIPLHYEPLNKQNTSSGNNTKDDGHEDCLELASLIEECEGWDSKGRTWHILSKGLLFRKAAMTFIALAKLKLTDNKYCAALKYIKLSLQCFEGLKVVLPQKSEQNKELLAGNLGIAGDLRLLLSKSTSAVEEFQKEMATSSDEEISIIECVEKEVTKYEYQWVYTLDENAEVNLRQSVETYQLSIQLIQGISSGKQVVVNSLTKRLGNALNETGVWYMHQAQGLLQTEECLEKPSATMEELWSKSKSSLLQGIQLFEDVGDTANQALLYCNCGRLMRLCAQTYTNITMGTKQPEFSRKERHYYMMAVEFYQKALSVGDKQIGPGILDSIYWELSTTYFNMGTLLQDYAPLSHSSQEEVEKEVTDFLNKSLKYCHREHSGERTLMYQYREGSINHRLASLFHNSLRNQLVEQKKKYLRQLAETHYERALGHFKSVECYMEWLRVGLEWVAMLEFCLTGQTNAKARIKTLLQMLHLVVGCRDPIGGLLKQLDDPDSELKVEQEGETITKIIETRIQFILLQLVKAYKSSGRKSKEPKATIEELKSLYAQSLQQDKSDKEHLSSLKGRWTFLHTFLEKICNFYHRKTLPLE